MAKIPIYQQQELASRRVGTPGVDKSGEMLANSIMQSTNEVTNAELGAQSHNNAMVQAMQTQATNQLGTDLRQRQAINAQIAVHQTNRLNDQDITNHTSKYTLAATQMYGDLASDPSIPPEELPGKVRDGLLGLQKDYSRNNITNPVVASGFAKNTDGQIESLFSKATNDMLTFRTENSLNLQKSTEDDQINSVTTPTAYQALKTDMFSADQLKNYAQAYGTKAPLARDRVLKGAALNVLNAAADAAPNTIANLRASNMFTNHDDKPILNEGDWNRVQTYADAKINTLQTQAAKSYALNTAKQTTDLVSNALAAPAEQAPKALQDLVGAIQLENNKPVKGPNDPIFDGNNNVISYRNDQSINTLTKARDKVLSAQQADKNAADRVATAEWRAEHAVEIAGKKANAAVQMQTIDEGKARLAGLPNTDEAKQARVSINSAMDALRSTSPDGKQEKKTFQTSAEDVQAFTAASAQLHNALLHGYISDDQAQSLRKELGAIHTRLTGGKPGNTDAALLEKMYGRLNAPASNSLRYIMSTYAGRTADDTNRELTANLLSTYNRFVLKSGGRDPSVQVIQDWRNKLAERMKAQAVVKIPAAKPIPSEKLLIPPPPPDVPQLWQIPEEE